MRRDHLRNVLALLPGTTRTDEAVVYMGALGPPRPLHVGSPDGDNIYNGAIDNATGVAGVLEIAEAFTPAAADARALGAVPDRSTLEESGLLGSRYYADASGACRWSRPWP